MESMVAEFKIDWARAIEDAAIEYADAYTELQCDADNDHQREHLKALKDLRETIKRGLEVAAAPQPAARGVPEGWKIVPKVATTEMILALMGTGLRHAEYRNKAASPSIEEMKQGYRAMLAAAPQPAAQPERKPMTRDEIRAEWDKFIEYPSESRLHVTTTSALLFAEHIAQKCIKDTP